MAERDFDVIIAGGSFVGLTLALALSKASLGALRVAVADAASKEQQLSAGFDGRAAAITAAAQQMLSVLGVWDALAGEAQPVTAIDITDSALETPVRTVLLHFDAMLSPGQPAAFIVENLRLREALFKAASAGEGVSLIMPAAIKSFWVDDYGVRAQLADATIKARLLVAADGQKSTLRNLAGIKTLNWDSDQVGIVTSVAHEKPHEGRAVQHFLPHGPFAILPLTGNRSSLVWTEHKREAQRILSLSEADIVKEIERRFGRGLGRLSLLARPAAYPLTMTLARQFVKPRFALAGDAAHGLHWIAGQGLNHGLKDVAALAEVIIDAARLGLDIGDIAVLRRYERWRRFDSAASAMAAGLLNGLFSNDFMPFRLLRDFGISAVDRLPPLKQFFVKEAAGLTGDVPKLLRGEPV